jgi:L-rhamnose mutarotase
MPPAKRQAEHQMATVVPTCYSTTRFNQVYGVLQLHSIQGYSILDDDLESKLYMYLYSIFDPDDLFEHIPQVWLHLQWQHCCCCLTSLSIAISCSIERMLFFLSVPLACLLRNILISLVTCKKWFMATLNSSHFTHHFIISYVTCRNRYVVWICFWGLSLWEVKWNTDMFLETGAQKCIVVIVGYILKWPKMTKVINQKCYFLKWKTCKSLSLFRRCPMFDFIFKW